MTKPVLALDDGIAAVDLPTMQRLKRYITARIGQALDSPTKAALQDELSKIWAELQMSALDVQITGNTATIYWPPPPQQWPHGLPSNDVINAYLDAHGAP